MAIRIEKNEFGSNHYSITKHRLLPLDKGRWSALHDFLVRWIPGERTGGFEDAGSMFIGTWTVLCWQIENLMIC